MKIEISLGWAILISLLIPIGQFLSSVWIKTTLEGVINLKYQKTLEQYRYELQAKERAEKIAEYLSLYFSDSKDFERMTKLSYELALWLPADIYRSLGKSVKNAGPEMDKNQKTFFDVLIDARKYLLSEPGDLTANDLISHKEGIGKKNHKPNPAT